MKKILLVLKYEFRYVISRRSFILSLFLLPLISSVAVLIMSSSQNSGANAAGNAISQVFAPQEKITLEGFVDPANWVKTIPAWYQDRFQRYDTENDARAAMEKGTIQGYYLVSTDYLDSGAVEYVRTDYSPVSGLETSGIFEDVLNYNLLDDPALYQRFNAPYQLTFEYTSSARNFDENNGAAFVVPYVMMMLLFITTFTSASMLLNNITDEKKNRVLEVLMTSITPLQMLTGKIIALGLVGFLQVTVWGATGLMVMRLSGQSLNIPQNMQIAPATILWGLVFFVLGYLLYASFMAGIGALVSNLKEASQVTMLVVLPAVVPMMLSSIVITRPDSLVPVILSIFPLTASVTMMTRMAATQVPIWQVLLSAALLLATALLVLRSVAGMFRAQNLLSGQAFSAKVFFRALAGKN